MESYVRKGINPLPGLFFSAIVVFVGRNSFVCEILKIYKYLFISEVY